MTTTSALVPNRVIVTDEQRRRLREDGYYITDVLFDEATLQTVRDAFQEVWDRNVAATLKRTTHALTIELAKFRPFLSQLDHHHEVCKAFIRHRVFQELAEQHVGPNVDITWNQAILKPPQKGGTIDNAFAWHQDQWYAQKGDYAKDSNWEILTDPKTSITCWVAISRTTVDNGTLWVIPGGHKKGLLEHVWSEDRREWQGQYDTSWKVPAVLKPGQMLVFDKFLPHSSGANVSEETRMAYQIGYGVPGLKLKPSVDVTQLLRDGKEVEWAPAVAGG